MYVYDYLIDSEREAENPLGRDNRLIAAVIAAPTRGPVEPLAARPEEAPRSSRGAMANPDGPVDNAVAGRAGNGFDPAGSCAAFADVSGTKDDGNDASRSFRAIGDNADNVTSIPASVISKGIRCNTTQRATSRWSSSERD